VGQLAGKRVTPAHANVTPSNFDLNFARFELGPPVALWPCMTRGTALRALIQEETP